MDNQGIDQINQDLLTVISEKESNKIADVDIWLHVSTLIANIALDAQFNVYKYIYRNRTPSNPGPVYIADSALACNANTALSELGISDIQKLHEFSTFDQEKFYDYVLNKIGIKFQEPYLNIKNTNESPHTPEWFPGSKINITDSCFNKKTDVDALVYDDENNNVHTVSYKELLNRVNAFGGYLLQYVKPKDHVAIFMPMNTEVIVAYLALIKIGAVVVSIADSFSSEEIQLRLDISKADFVITQFDMVRANKTILMYERLLEAKPPKTFIFPTDSKCKVRQDHIVINNYYDDNTAYQLDSYSCKPSDCINILFSSGTTGAPKSIPWDHTTAIRAAMDGYFNQDVNDRSVFSWPTNMGWMMGPWLVFATLINNGTIALTNQVPTSLEFGKFVEKAKVDTLGVVPSIVKAWINNGIISKINFSNIKLFTSTGESSNPMDMFYLMASAGNKPVIEYCGGTEIGGAYISGTLLHDSIPATFPTPNFGTNLAILDPNGEPCEKGQLALVPGSLGMSHTLLNKDHYKVYFEDMPIWQDNIHYRRHGDEFQVLENGYFRALGRCDDTMNLGGIKTSSAEIERCFTDIEGLGETAAISYQPQSGGPSDLVVYYVSNQEIEEPTLMLLMQSAIKEKLNPLFKIKEICRIDKLPRTSSNKVLRRSLRNQHQEK